MEELQKIKIRMEAINQYGDKFAIEQEVDEEYTEDDGEMGVYHNAYLSFLNAVGFVVDKYDRVAIIGENEYIEEYCNDGEYCDSDCENCYINE